MSILDRFRRPHRPGLRHSAEAWQWASVHFPESRRRIAALVAGIFCEQTGAPFSELHASSHFTYDIGHYEYFDTVDYVRALSDEFRIAMSDEDMAGIQRISDLVEYLYVRVGT
jgi:acyl carrier protein